MPSGGCEPCDGYELFIGYEPGYEPRDGYELFNGFEPLVMIPLVVVRPSHRRRELADRRKKKQKQQILITGEQVFKSDMSCWYLPLTLLRYDFGVYRLPHGNVVSRFSFILHSSIALGWSYLR